MNADPPDPAHSETTEPLSVAYRLEPGDRVDGYEIDEPLKAGGWGQVFVAHRTSNHRQVAVKTIKPEHAADPAYRKRFTEEQKAFAQLERHPNLCPAFDWNEKSQGLLWLAMPWIDGQDLFAIVGQAPLKPHRAADLIAQAADGLHEVHTKTNRAHRDVHPGNLMVEDDDRLLVIDFGLAKRFNHPSGSPAEPRESIWTAPEGRRGEEMTAQADVYSLGLVLAYALTGAPPDAGKPQFPPNLSAPERLREIVAEATAEELDDRTSSAAELAERLREYLRPPDAHRPPVPPERDEPLESPPSRRVVHSGAAIAIAILVGLLAFGLTAGLVPSGAESSTDPPVEAAGVSFAVPESWRPVSVAAADRKLGMQEAVTGPDATVLVGAISRSKVPIGTPGNRPVEIALPAGKAMRADDVGRFDAQRMFVFHTARGYPAIVCRGAYGASRISVEAACRRVATRLSLQPPPRPIPYPSPALQRQAAHALHGYAKARRTATAAIEAAEAHADVKQAADSVADAAQRSASWLHDRQLTSLRAALADAAQAWRAAAAAAHRGSGFHHAGAAVREAEQNIREVRLELLGLGYRR